MGRFCKSAATVLTAALVAGCNSGKKTEPQASSVPESHTSSAPADAAPATAPAELDTPSTTADATDWKSLFDGQSLDGWKVADFAGHGEPEVEDGELYIPVGEGLSGITYSGEAPTMNYEVEVTARRVDGVDFGAITFPVADTHATFITGGWGGTVVGISSINDEDAANNETTTFEKFERDQWYTFRVRVEPKKISAYIDDKQVVDLETEGRELSLRFGMEPASPLGVCTWQTTAAIKSIKLRKL